MAKPLAQSAKMLLTAGSRVTNTDLKWNEARTRTQSQGESPSLIEPVTGTVTLRNLDQAAAVSVSALDGAGQTNRRTDSGEEDGRWMGAAHRRPRHHLVRGSVRRR